MSHSRIILNFARWLSVYYCVALTFLFLTRPLRSFSWGADLYFAFYTFVCCLLFWKTRWPESVHDEPNYSFKNRDGWIVIALTLSGICLRFYHLHDLSLWLDEFTEASMSRVKFPLLASAGEHQPPLDYLLSGWAQSVLGVNELSIRFHSALMSALTLPLGYMLFYRVSKSRIFSLALVSVFTVWRMAWIYAAEARPVSLGIFHCLLFFTIIEIIFRISRSPTKAMLRAVFAAALLFTASIGLQPVFLLLAFSIALLPFLLNQEFQHRSWQILIICFRTVVLFLPMQLLILKLSQPRFSRSFEESIALMCDSFLHRAFREANTALYPLLLIFAVLAIFALVAILAKRIPFLRKQFQVGERAALLFLMTATSALFLVILIPFFHGFVVWPFYPRYVSLVAPVILLSAALTFRFIGQVMTQRSFKMLFVIAVISFLIIVVDPRKLNLDSMLSEMPREDLRGAFLYLQREAEVRDLVFLLSLPNSTIWWPQELYGWDVYYRRGLPQRAQIYDEADMFASSYKNLFSDFEPRKLHVVFEPMWSSFDIGAGMTVRHPEISRHDFKLVSVFTIDISGPDWRRQWFSFLDELEKMTFKMPCPTLAEYKLQQALYEKDRAAFLRYRELVINTEPDVIHEARFAAYRADAQRLLAVPPVGRGLL